jgi:hypothetical protein
MIGCFPFDGQAPCDLVLLSHTLHHCSRHVIHVVVGIDPSGYRKPDKFQLRIPVQTCDRVAVCQQGADLRTSYASLEVYLNCQSLCGELIRGRISGKNFPASMKMA